MKSAVSGTNTSPPRDHQRPSEPRGKALRPSRSIRASLGSSVDRAGFPQPTRHPAVVAQRHVVVAAATGDADVEVSPDLDEPHALGLSQSVWDGKSHLR